MQTPEEIKQNIKGLVKRYYEVEKELKKLNNYELGDGSQEDLKSNKLTILWINIRNEIFYQRALLARAYKINS